MIEVKCKRNRFSKTARLHRVSFLGPQHARLRELQRSFQLLDLVFEGLLDRDQLQPILSRLDPQLRLCLADAPHRVRVILVHVADAHRR